MKLKLFLWTKLLVYLLLTKYLILVSAPLNVDCKFLQNYTQTITQILSGEKIMTVVKSSIKVIFVKDL